MFFLVSRLGVRGVEFWDWGLWLRVIEVGFRAQGVVVA